MCPCLFRECKIKVACCPLFCHSYHLCNNCNYGNTIIATISRIIALPLKQVGLVSLMETAIVDVVVVPNRYNRQILGPIHHRFSSDTSSVP